MVKIITKKDIINLRKKIDEIIDQKITPIKFYWILLNKIHQHCIKIISIRSYSAQHLSHLDGIRIDREVRKYGLEQLQIWTLFTKCQFMIEIQRVCRGDLRSKCLWGGWSGLGESKK